MATDSSNLQPTKQTIVAGYARFSPDDTTKISIEMQDAAMKRVCRDKGWAYYKTYIDENMTGAWPPLQLAKDGNDKQVRPGLTELLDDMGMDNFNLVMVYEVARMARDQGMFWTIIDMMNAKATLCCTAMVPDITSDKPEFQMVAGVLQSVAAFQRVETKKKTKDALATLKSKGYAVSRAPLGFKLVPENPNDPDHSHSLLVLDDLGRSVQKELEANPKLKPKALMEMLGVGYKTAWHLIRNVRND